MPFLCRDGFLVLKVAVLTNVASVDKDALFSRLIRVT